MKKTLLKTTALLGAAVLLSACTNTPEECDPSVELNMFSKATCQFPEVMTSVLNKKKNWC